MYLNLKKKAGQTGNNGTKNVEIMVVVNYLSNFWRTIEVPLINCEITPYLTYSTTCVVFSNALAAQVTIFAVTNTKLDVPFATLSTQDNAKLLQQLKSGYKITINWNNYKWNIFKKSKSVYKSSSWSNFPLDK